MSFSNKNDAESSGHFVKIPFLDLKRAKLDQKSEIGHVRTCQDLFYEVNLSLFSDYNPTTTTQGLGFKDKNKAIYTIEAIKSRELRYQVNVIATMMGRAKKHPNRTKGMEDAIKVFNSWMKDYKNNKKIK